MKIYKKINIYIYIYENHEKIMSDLFPAEYFIRLDPLSDV
jgi:hypothetical protein